MRVRSGPVSVALLVFVVIGVAGFAWQRSGPRISRPSFLLALWSLRTYRLLLRIQVVEVAGFLYILRRISALAMSGPSVAQENFRDVFEVSAKRLGVLDQSAMRQNYVFEGRTLSLVFTVCFLMIVPFDPCIPMLATSSPNFARREFVPGMRLLMVITFDPSVLGI